jgi:hypothetical protein
MELKPDGLNSLWRTSEIVRTVGFAEVARWLEARETHHPGVEGQHEPWIMTYPTSLDHFMNSGFMSLEDR